MTTAAMSSVLLQVSNGSDPIAGATAFVGGVAVGVTDTLGHLTIPVPPNRTSQIKVRASGYADFVDLYVNGDLTTEIDVVTVVLAVAASPPTQQITLSIPTPGASYSVTGPAGFTDGGTTDSGGNADPAKLYLPGTYSIVWSYAGVSPRTDPLSVQTGQRLYSFAPLAVGDADTGTAADTSGATTPSTANPSGIQLAADQMSLQPASLSAFATNSKPSAELAVSWPPYNYGKYFTPTQAFMYIGDVFIDELNGFQYTLQGNKIPVFGYSSYMMDAVGTGKSLVQGQLTINFISDGYLYTVLSEYKARAASARPDDEQAALNLVDQYTVLVSSGAASNASGKAQMVAVRQQLNQLLANNNNLPSVIANARKSAQSVGLNPVYSRTPFDIMLQFEGGGRKLTRWVKGCVLTSNEQILGDSDSTVLEAYGFIARSVS